MNRPKFRGSGWGPGYKLHDADTDAIKNGYYISEFAMKAAAAIMRGDDTVTVSEKEYKVICDITEVISYEFPDENSNVTLNTVEAIGFGMKANAKLKEALMIRDIIE